MKNFVIPILTAFISAFLIKGPVYAADIPKDAANDTISTAGQTSNDEKTAFQRLVNGCSNAFNGGRFAGGCSNAPDKDSPAGGCSDIPKSPLDTETDTTTDAAYSQFEGSYELTGITYYMADKPINAGKFLGELGTDWFGSVIVTADGHIEVDFTMPKPAAQMAGRFSLDIIEVTENTIQVTYDECETDSGQVFYSVNGNAASITFDTADFCQAKAAAKPRKTTFDFAKVVATDTNTDTHTDTDTHTGRETDDESAGATMHVPIQAESPITLQSPCMINSLIHLN